jgi:hypothetical protein
MIWKDNTTMNGKETDWPELIQDTKLAVQEIQVQ